MDILYYFENFTPEFLYIETAILMILLTILVFIWLYNKKRYNALKHQIPAGVVKNYLDSIIQNSSSLKSSLFRDGVDVNGLPSVMPISNLPGGDSIEINTDTGSVDSARINAQLAALQAKINEKNAIIKELEDRLNNMPASGDEDTAALEAQLKTANAQLVALKSQPTETAAVGIDEGIHNEVVKERDELAEKLKEYEVIEDDLANLKRLKQENEQLKKSLGGGDTEAGTEVTMGSEAAPEEVAEEVQEASPVDDLMAEVPFDEANQDEIDNAFGGPAEEAVAEESIIDESSSFVDDVTEPSVAEEAPVEQLTDSAEDETAELAPDSEEEKKTPEDLLSEFEKMLG